MNRKKPTYYEVLGIAPDFSTQAIKGLRSTLGKIYHPDSGTARNATRMSEINDACDVLGDINKRREYDEKLKAAREAEIVKIKTEEGVARADAARKRREQERGASDAKAHGDYIRNRGGAGTKPPAANSSSGVRPNPPPVGNPSSSSQPSPSSPVPGVERTHNPAKSLLDTMGVGITALLTAIGSSIAFVVIGYIYLVGAVLIFAGAFLAGIELISLLVTGHFVGSGSE